MAWLLWRCCWGWWHCQPMHALRQTWHVVATSLVSGIALSSVSGIACPSAAATYA